MLFSYFTCSPKSLLVHFFLILVFSLPFPLSVFSYKLLTSYFLSFPFDERSYESDWQHHGAHHSVSKAKRGARGGGRAADRSAHYVLCGQADSAGYWVHSAYVSCFTFFVHIFSSSIFFASMCTFTCLCVSVYVRVCAKRERSFALFFVCVCVCVCPLVSPPLQWMYLEMCNIWISLHLFRLTVCSYFSLMEILLQNPSINFGRNPVVCIHYI